MDYDNPYNEAERDGSSPLPGRPHWQFSITVRPAMQPLKCSPDIELALSRQENYRYSICMVKNACSAAVANKQAY